MSTILVISENQGKRNQLQGWLLQEGFGVLTAGNIQAGESELLSEQSDLAIIHVSGQKNLQVLVELAARITPCTIVLNDESSDVEIAVTLGILGADFYAPASMGKHELTARINTLLRLATPVA